MRRRHIKLTLVCRLCAPAFEHRFVRIAPTVGRDKLLSRSFFSLYPKWNLLAIKSVLWATMAFAAGAVAPKTKSQFGRVPANHSKKTLSVPLEPDVLKMPRVRDRRNRRT